jgi:pSer/pThr/pTyr-binding forkhead associated (FHA) protein
VTVMLSLNRTDGKKETFDFDSYSHCLVGRAEDCDIRLPSNLMHADISRHHCLFEIDPPHIRLRDLGSRNGTFVNDEMIGQRGPEQSHLEAGKEIQADRELKDGDVVRVGNSKIEVHVEVPAWVHAPPALM